MNYTIYNADTGEILSVFTISDQSQVDINLAGKSWIEGRYSADQYYIENGEPVVKTQQPQDGFPYNFDWSTKSWILDQDHLVEQTRMQRNQLLSAVDRVNPIWYAALSLEQQQELITYRQALLDVPQQSSFPEAVIWPSKPAWL